MPMPPMSRPPLPDDESRAPRARRPGLVRQLARGALRVLFLVVAVAAVVAVALFVLPRTRGAEQLLTSLGQLRPMFAVVYAVALFLVWTQWQRFMDWLGRRHGRRPLPDKVSRAGRNCLLTLLAVMELTVLLNWLGGTVR